MSDNDFTASIVVPQSPEQVFDAVLNVRAWWGEAIDTRTTTVGDEFTFTDHVEHWVRFRLTEVTPGRRVVWHAVDSRLDFVENRTEWTGTRVVFDITSTADGTVLRFTHEGLLPSVECYEACSKGWSFYIHQSLKDLITRGAGDPMPKP